jgi:pyridoxal 5'-phosphate synthase pdxS subunit
MMQLGAEAVFVGSGIFKASANHDRRHEDGKLRWRAEVGKRARAIVRATTHFRDPQVVAEVSENLGQPMVGIETSKLAEGLLMQTRGW